jgi:hypothetical protein
MPDIKVPAGQLNLKGPQAPTGVDRWIQDVAPLTFAGLVLTLVISGTSTTVAMPAGSLVYQGLTQTVRTGDLQVTVPAGQIVLKGPARPAAVPQLSAGALAFTGRTLNVAVDVPGSALSIPAGSLVYTGRVPDRIPTQTISVPVGSLALTGQYASIAFKQPDTGRLVWTGLAPTIAAGTIGIAVPVGTLGWHGLAPVVHTDFFTAVPAGQLVLQGLTPNVGSPNSIVIPVGTLQLQGRAPTIDWVTAIPAGSLVYASTALQIDLATATQSIPAGAITFQGYGFDLIHSNGTAIDGLVKIARSVTDGVVITRALNAEVHR